MAMTVGSLFSGIGGFDLGLERAGMTVRWQVENDPYCNRVLRKHWPDVVRYGDIRTVAWGSVEPVDLICGGFPCQPVSVAGKRRGREDERWLWPEFAQCVGILRPRYVLIENVPGLAFSGAGFDIILSDLASMRYNVEWDSLRASSFGAPYRRERIYFLAVSNGVNGEERVGIQPNRTSPIFAGCDRLQFPVWLQTADQFIGMDDGVRGRLYRLRGEAVGNAVVPQVVEWIGRRISAVA